MAKSPFHRHSVRVPDYMNDFIREDAERKGLSLNQLIVTYIDRVIYDYERSMQGQDLIREFNELVKKAEGLENKKDGKESAGA